MLDREIDLNVLHEMITGEVYGDVVEGMTAKASASGPSATTAVGHSIQMDDSGLDESGLVLVEAGGFSQSGHEISVGSLAISR